MSILNEIIQRLEAVVGFIDSDKAATLTNVKGKIASCLDVIAAAQAQELAEARRHSQLQVDHLQLKEAHAKLEQQHFKLETDLAKVKAKDAEFPDPKEPMSTPQLFVLGKFIQNPVGCDLISAARFAQVDPGNALVWIEEWVRLGIMEDFPGATKNDPAFRLTPRGRKWANAVSAEQG